MVQLKSKRETRQIDNVPGQGLTAEGNTGDGSPSAKILILSAKTRKVVQSKAHLPQSGWRKVGVEGFAVVDSSLICLPKDLL